jgi:hypothetical protein
MKIIIDMVGTGWTTRLDLAWIECMAYGPEVVFEQSMVRGKKAFRQKR